MSRVETNQSSASHEIKNNISKVVIEPEKPYGIYLPDWQSVVNAVQTLVAGDFQMAPLSKEEVAREKALRVEDPDPLNYNQYTNVELATLSDMYSRETAQPEEVSRTLNAAKKGLNEVKRAALYYTLFDDTLTSLYDTRECNTYNFQGGSAFYGKVLVIEALGAKNTEEGERYKSPYLMTLHSKFFEDNGEAKLVEELGQGRPALSRNVLVHFGREKGDVSKIDFEDVAATINNGLGTNVSWRDMLHDVYPERNDDPSGLYPISKDQEKNRYSIGIFDGLEVKVRPLNAHKKSKEGHIVTYADSFFYCGIEYRPAALEFSIADPTRESQAYGSSHLIPPEKRAQAQHLAETIASSFSPTSA